MGQSRIDRGRFGSRLIVAAASLLIVASFRAALAAEPPPSIEGVWEGRYVCAQGPTGITLTLKAVPYWPGFQVYLHRLLMGWLRNPETEVQEVRGEHLEIEANFRFHALPDNPSVPTGAFELTGTFNRALGVLDLYPSQWLERPEGYDLVGVKGVLDEDGQRLKGASDGAGCGAIMLRRAGAEQPSAEASVPAAQVQFSDELLKLNRDVFQLYQAGAYDEALAKANEAVALAERVYGPEHPTTAAELKFVVQALRAAGRSAEAEPLIRRALAIDEKTLGPDNPAVALDIQILVGVLIDQTLKDAEPPVEGNRILLTGQLPGILEKAVPLALVASLLLLWIYRRAVKRSMLRRADAGEAPPPSEETPSAPTPPAAPLQFVTVDGASVHEMAASEREARGLVGPWRNAAIYALAGIGYVLALTAAYLYAGGVEFLPVRFVFFALAYAWPIVLTIGLVAPISWRGWIAAIAIYALLFAAISAIGVARSDAFSWGQAARLWLLTNIPGTFLILAFLPRPIRAVGPLVLVFMVAAVAGSSIWHNLFNAGGSELMLRAVHLFAALGLNTPNAVATATFAAELIGVAILSLIGWAFLRGLGRLYLWRLISDQSVLIDSLWFLFALTGVVDFAFFDGFWFLAPLGAFAIYKAIAMLGFAVCGEKPAGVAADPKLLLLRVFSLGKRSARLFEAFGRLWRHAGRIRLIAGPDLATSTVEPHEFLDFLSGKLGRRFISGPETLARRLSETGQRRDFDGRYRVDDFFCHDDAWQMVLKRLARDSDAVLMDLRGFLPGDQGCVFEINELLNVVPLGRVVSVIDATTDLAFLRQTFADGWEALAAASPNRGLVEPQLLLFEFTGESSVPGLMRVVMEAAKGGSPAHPAPSPSARCGAAPSRVLNH